MASRTEVVASVVYTNQQIVEAATGRWGEVAHEVKPADPYVITKPDGSEITITPLTRRRRKALKAAQAAYLMTGAQLAEVQNENTADQGTISRISAVLDEAEHAYDVALFGGEEITREIVDYFDDLDEAYWDSMYQDVHDRLVNRVPLPSADEVAESGEGKESSSSTSSTDTGTKSKAISSTT